MNAAAAKSTKKDHKTTKYSSYKEYKKAVESTDTPPKEKGNYFALGFRSVDMAVSQFEG